MDPESLATTKTNAPRKVRFAPKGPPRRAQKPVVTKVEKVEDDVDAAQAQELLRRLNEASIRAKPKAERKGGPTQVAFGFGGSSTSIKSYGAPHSVNKYQSSYSGGSRAHDRPEKEYKEPWDYYSNYPVTLPLRRPYSGNPEFLDEEEFGEASGSLTYDECSTKPAIELGLMGENMEESMFFLQLPASMPMTRQPPNTESNETTNNSKSSKSVGPRRKVYHLDELPAGCMGKLLVYRSGAVKLKLGDNLYDVSEGLDCAFAQDVFAVNTEEKFCYSIGELNKRAIITPDVDHILDDEITITLATSRSGKTSS